MPASVRFVLLVALFLFTFPPVPVTADVALRVLRAPTDGPSLIHNGGFETTAAGGPTEWQPAPQGGVAELGAGRNGSTALAGALPDQPGWVGASQTITLNQTNPAPVLVRGWSRAENVSGTPGSDYALYVDVIYTDGTPLWGQTAHYRCGTHDWEAREVMIQPAKPIRSLTVHCLLRHRTGRVWFDDISATELRAAPGTVRFQGVTGSPPTLPSAPGPGRNETYATKDGLSLDWNGDAVTRVQCGPTTLARRAWSGFLLRDAATNSDFHTTRAGRCGELGLAVRARIESETNRLTVAGRLSDLTHSDRAVTMVFALPLEADGWSWGDDIHRQRRIGGTDEYLNPVNVACGATGTMSVYPLAAVWNQEVGLGVALDMAWPAVYRVGYHAGTRQLFIAYDLGLVPETQHFPGAADFRFVLFRFDHRGGFRAAFQKYMEMFPAAFAVRTPDQGLWMPFTDVSRVQGWEDFGFRFHEGNNNVPWDDAHGVLSFRYTEPMTWWMRMAKGLPRTPATALQVRDQLATGPDPHLREMAGVSQLAAMHDEEGAPALQFQDTPWCDGAVWSLNPNPHLPTNAVSSANAATVHWNPSLRDSLYGAKANGQLDGEYLDSLEGYMTADLNYRREHFLSTTVPLTFATATKRPALFKGLAVAEFTRWMADDVHRLGKLMFANGVPYRFTFLCPWLDVMGTETDWLQGGQYRPPDDATLALWRTMSGAKPYLLLMNTDYNAFGPDKVERYFARSLFYGFFPGFFSHNAADNPYWQNPAWYNRDRPLFKQYLPLIKRVAEAGWRPWTTARSHNDQVWLERFGPSAAGEIFLTAYNDSGTTQTTTIGSDGAPAGIDYRSEALEALSGRRLEATPAGWTVSVESGRTAVLVVRPQGE